MRQLLPEPSLLLIAGNIQGQRNQQRTREAKNPKLFTSERTLLLQTCICVILVRDRLNLPRAGRFRSDRDTGSGKSCSQGITGSSTQDAMTRARFVTSICGLVTRSHHVQSRLRCSVLAILTQQMFPAYVIICGSSAIQNKPAP